MTKKKVLLRGLIGIPIGVTIGYAITVIIALIAGNGSFSPVVPAMAEAMGSETVAVAVQLLGLCAMGFIFAVASCIWEVERWSLTRQTILHFLAISSTTLLIAYICRWAEYTPGALWGYLGIFVAIYVVIWLSISLSVRRKIKKIDRRLGGAD